MKIQYLGHACFRIISQMGTTIICDPYGEEMMGFAMPRLGCDVVTVSHHHGDHDAIDQVKGSPAILEKEVYLAADDIAVQSIKSWHDDKQGSLRGENWVFCFLVDGLKVVHLGDIGELNADLANTLAGCDVLLLPVGGKFTIDPKGAKWYVDKIAPKICIPMHYKTEQVNFVPFGVDDFTKLFDKTQVTFAHSETLMIDDQPEEGTKIVVLDKYAD